MPASSESSSNIGRPDHILQQSCHRILQFVLNDLGSTKTRGIRLPRILKTQMGSLLQRLNPPHQPMRYYGSTISLVIRLQPLNFSKEKVDLIYVATPGIPTRFLHRGASSSKRKRRRHIPNIEPHFLPVDDLVTQLIRDVLWLLPLMKLQPSTPNYIYLRITGLGFQMKEVLE